MPRNFTRHLFGCLFGFYTVLYFHSEFLSEQINIVNYKQIALVITRTYDIKRNVTTLYLLYGIHYFSELRFNVMARLS